MNSTSYITHDQVLSIKEVEVTENEDYARLLDTMGIRYQVNDPYLDCGHVSENGWVIDISVILTQFTDLLRQIAPVLKSTNTGFRIPRDAGAFVYLTSASPGYEHFGKMISIYPTTADQAANLAQYLVNLTTSRKVKGPVIPTALPLGGTIYARYGVSSVDGGLLPKGISWPFTHTKPLPVTQPVFRKGRAYRLIETLKADIKGNVYKAINLKKWWKLQFTYCLIKEGKHDMSYDSSGRTIIDRLEMQRRLHTDLAGKINIPSSIDYFFQDGNAYLVTDFIEGRQLNEVCVELTSGSCWWATNTSSRLKILSYLTTILQAIEILHREGYLHRDITPVNFLVDKDDKVWFIDLELAYNEQIFRSRSPFTYGTEGFMSPEQARADRPTPAQDIYAIGALMISMLAAVHPARLKPTDKTNLLEQLKFLFGENDLAVLVTDCLSPVPEARPSLREITHFLVEYSTRFPHEDSQIPKSVSVEDTTRQLLEQHLPAFATEQIPSQNNVWLSLQVGQRRVVANNSHQLVIAPWLFNGLSGILYLMAEAKYRDYNLTAIEQHVIASWGFLEQHVLSKANSIEGGLYQGSHGVAIALAAGIRSGAVIRDNITTGFLHQLVQRPTFGLSLATGTAGKIICLLYCRDVLPKTLFDEELDRSVQELKTAQADDGSWSFPAQERPNIKRQYYNRSQGVAGVLSSLLTVYALSKDENLKSCLIKGLEWLLLHAQRTSSRIYWTTHPKSKLIEPWLTAGNLGIITTFLEAYQILKIPKYKDIAESALFTYPPYIICDNLTIANGLSGLGVTYLRAALSTGNQDWVYRATHILTLLKYTKVARSANAIYWLAQNSNYTTADLMTGNAGITYFLLCINNPDLLTNAFPI